MSARTCQLCGKPLSRIWVGAGEDFCSREHRNQYRLRKGMDRLQEASKVATLMRKREQPKTILTEDLLVVGVNEPRSTTSPLPFELGEDVFNYPILRYEARVEPPPRRPFVKQWKSVKGSGERTGAAAEFSVFQKFTSRLKLSRARLENKWPGSGHLGRTRDARRLRNLGRKGNAFRVSTGAPFRLGKIHRRDLPLLVKLKGALQPVPPRVEKQRPLLFPATQQLSKVLIPLGKKVEPQFPDKAPRVTPLDGQPRHVPPTIRDLKIANSRMAKVDWPERQQEMPGEIPFNDKTWRGYAPYLKRLPRITVKGHDDSRTTTVPLKPQDMEYSRR